MWTLLIGLFLLQNANRTAQFGEIQGRLQGLTAADAVTSDSPVVNTTTTLRDFADDTLLSGDITWRKFLVTNDEGELIGTVRVEALKQIPREQWAAMTVDAIMESCRNRYGYCKFRQASAGSDSDSGKPKGCTPWRLSGKTVPWWVFWKRLRFKPYFRTASLKRFSP